MPDVVIDAKGSVEGEPVDVSVQRNLLRYRYRYRYHDGLSIDEVGSLYHVG